MNLDALIEITESKKGVTKTKRSLIPHRYVDLNVLFMTKFSILLIKAYINGS